MVAKVSSGKNILGLLNYNENKVKEGVAKCILENQFGCNVDRLTFNEKHKTFLSYINRNHRATTKAVHISLNFDPSEKLSKEILNEIAVKYMDKIGFGSQPYLVYEHFDAGHPHIHIVSTNIEQNGKRIILYNIGRNQSEKARKQLEREYKLVRAESKKKNQSEGMDPINVKRAVYGKGETKRTISNIIRFVTKSYKYTSVPEFNAALRQFNVMADVGKEGSKMNLKKGLLYSLIDAKGKKVGVPIKASSIYGKPTLAYLQKQYKLNAALRKPHKGRLTNCINDAFSGKTKTRKSIFIKSLNKEGIHVLFRQNDEGRVYGVTFVDNKTKVVFNGSDLGKAYGAKAIVERLTKMDSNELSNSNQIIDIPVHSSLGGGGSNRQPIKDTDLGIEQTVRELTDARATDFVSPDAATRKRRKKKKKGRSI